MQIQKVEDELGLTLFDRSKKPILPTDRGTAFIRQAKVVMQEAHRLTFVSQQDANVLRGDFRLGVIPTLSPYLLPLFIQKFSDRYPAVQLHIEELKTDEIVRAIGDDRIDAGLLVTPLKEPQIIEKPLFEEPFSLYVSPSHPLFQKPRIAQSELKGSEIWLLQEGHCLRNQVVRICSVPEKNQVLGNVHFESGSLETLQALVKNNKGYTLLPYLAVYAKTSKEERALIKEFIPPIPTREVSLVYGRTELKKDILIALEDSIVESLPPALKKTKIPSRIIPI